MPSRNAMTTRSSTPGTCVTCDGGGASPSSGGSGAGPVRGRAVATHPGRGDGRARGSARRIVVAAEHLAPQCFEPAFHGLHVVFLRRAGRGGPERGTGGGVLEQAPHGRGELLHVPRLDQHPAHA